MKTISYLRLKLNNHRRWIAGVMLLALAAGAWTGFNHLVPKVPGGLSSGKSRLGWYLSSGQWHADARTALAVANYVFSPDNQVPATTEPTTNSQVAGASPQPLPAAGVIRAGAGNPS